jgi:hypothetical protein
MRSMVEGRREAPFFSESANARFARAPPPHFVRSPSPANAGEDEMRRLPSPPLPGIERLRHGC